MLLYRNSRDKERASGGCVRNVSKEERNIKRKEKTHSGVRQTWRQLDHVRPLASFTRADHHRQTFGGRNRWAPSLCVSINRIIGTVTAASGRRGSAGWHSFRPPAGVRVNGPNGSTQSARARDQLLAEQLIIALFAIASADRVIVETARRFACEKSYLRIATMNNYRRLLGLSILSSVSTSRQQWSKSIGIINDGWDDMPLCSESAAVYTAAKYNIFAWVIMRSLLKASVLHCPSVAISFALLCAFNENVSEQHVDLVTVNSVSSWEVRCYITTPSWAVF